MMVKKSNNFFSLLSEKFICTHKFAQQAKTCMRKNKREVLLIQLQINKKVLLLNIYVRLKRGFNYFGNYKPQN